MEAASATKNPTPTNKIAKEPENKEKEEIKKNEEKFKITKKDFMGIKQIQNLRDIPYAIKKEIGRGAFGKVVLAEHNTTKEERAIKVVEKK